MSTFIKVTIEKKRASHEIAGQHWIDRVSTTSMLQVQRTLNKTYKFFNRLASVTSHFFQLIRVESSHKSF